MDLVEAMLDSGFRLGVLLAFVAVGEWVAERAGTLNISVEGMLLAGCFAAAAVGAATGNVVAGLAGGMAAGLLVALVHGNLSHRLDANQFVVGLTLNLFVVGLTAFLAEEVDTVVDKSSQVRVPLLADLPVVGTLFAERWPAYLVLAVVPVAWWLVFRSRWGLEVRAAGENPQAADVSGVPVNARRRQAMLFAGVVAGLGGASLVFDAGRFSTNMTAGRGFIALAAVIFGGWTLKGALAGCAVFGLTEALRIALQANGHQLNAQLLIAAPYVTALVTMAAVSLAGVRSRQPRALGRPFVRGLT